MWSKLASGERGAGLPAGGNKQRAEEPQACPPWLLLEKRYTSGSPLAASCHCTAPRVPSFAASAGAEPVQWARAAASTITAEGFAPKAEGFLLNMFALCSRLACGMIPTSAVVCFRAGHVPLHCLSGHALACTCWCPLSAMHLASAHACLGASCDK